MSTQPIEIILSRQLADSLSVPVFIVDTTGKLLFYNEPAEQLLGLRFEETGPMPAAEWSVLFKPHDANGTIVPPEQLPLVKTLTTQLPAQGSFWINSLDGSKFEISVTSFPIIGRPNRFLGAIAIFWQTVQE